MGLIAKAAAAMKIFMIIAIAFGALFFLYIKVFRKKKAGIKVDKDEKTGKLKDTSAYIPIESISGNIMKAKDEQRYIASINCKGFDFFASNIDEQLRTQEGYLNFINIIQSPITLRIDSAAVDLTAQINRHYEVYNKKYIEQGKLYDQFSQYVKLFREAKTDAERTLYQSTLSDIKHQLDVNAWKMEHIESLINYQKGLSGRKATPIQEERYIFDWSFNPAEFPDTITEKEIFERAETELNKREQRIRHALSAANVKCQRDGENELFNLVYRHFHPWSSDSFKTLADNNVDERIVTGKRSFDRARRNYEEALAAEDISKIISEQNDTAEVSEEQVSLEPTFYIEEKQEGAHEEPAAVTDVKNENLVTERTEDGFIVSTNEEGGFIL